MISLTHTWRTQVYRFTELHPQLLFPPVWTTVTVTVTGRSGLRHGSRTRRPFVTGVRTTKGLLPTTIVNNTNLACLSPRPQQRMVDIWFCRIIFNIKRPTVESGKNETWEGWDVQNLHFFMWTGWDRRRQAMPPHAKTYWFEASYWLLIAYEGQIRFSP